MPVKDDLRNLLAGGARPEEIKRALKEVEDELVHARHEAEIPGELLPEIPKDLVAALQALHTRLGDAPKHQPFSVLQEMHAALDAGDMPRFLRLALLSLPKAVWAQSPGHRRSG